MGRHIPRRDRPILLNSSRSSTYPPILTYLWQRLYAGEDIELLFELRKGPLEVINFLLLILYPPEQLGVVSFLSKFLRLLLYKQFLVVFVHVSAPIPETFILTPHPLLLFAKVMLSLLYDC